MLGVVRWWSFWRRWLINAIYHKKKKSLKLKQTTPSKKGWRKSQSWLWKEGE